MKKSSALFLQIVVVLVGIGALAFLLWEPTIEGSNAHASLFAIYFNDPFLAWAYAASIAFFVALYQAFKLLGYMGSNELFSERSVKALRAIKFCATALVAFAVAAEAYLFIVRPGDDIAGGVFMGLLMIAIFGAGASAAARLETVVRRPQLQTRERLKQSLKASGSQLHRCRSAHADKKLSCGAVSSHSILQKHSRFARFFCGGDVPKLEPKGRLTF